MKLIIKRILVICWCLVCLPAFCDVFSTNGHRKANGLNIELYYPAGWFHEEGVRPHIVQKFTDKSGDYCMLIIVNTGHNLSAKQWDNEFRYMTTSDYRDILEGGDVKSVKLTKYEGLSGALVQYELNKERAGIKLYASGLVHIFGYKNSLVLMQCAAADLTKQGAIKKYEAVKMDFLSFGNGLVLLNKYDLQESELEEYDGVNVGFIIILLLSFILITLIFVIVYLKQNQTQTKSKKTTVYKKKKSI